MSPWLIVASLLAVLTAGAGGFKLGVDHEVAAQAREDEHIAQAVDAANAAAAEAISKIKVTNRTILQEVERETRTNTVYVDCRHTPAGLSGVNSALTGEPSGSGKLPQTDTPAR